MSNKYDPPQTRVEAILLNILGESYKLDPPQTRVELLLQAILEQGGGGGTEPVVKYKGVTTTPISDGSTTNPVEINGELVTAETGDFVAYNGAEFIWNGTAWQELGDLELVAAIMTSIAPTYAESETYNTGDRVYYNDILYECIDDNVTGEFNPAKWDGISVTQVLSELENDIELVSSDIQAVSAMISDTYKTTSTYDIGDLVIYNKKFYRCNTADTTGAWDASKWDETSVAAQLNEIRSAISNLTDAVNGLIDDNSTSTDTTWSSSKISSEISSEVQKIIDDTASSNDSTWSSSKIEEEIDNKSVTKTATGNPIEITDGADAPLVECVSEIQGSQDLHGYDKPWVGGAGKNKFDGTIYNSAYTDADFNLGTTAPTIQKSIKLYLQAGTYTISFIPPSLGVTYRIIRRLFGGGYNTTHIEDITHYTFTTTIDGYVGLSFRHQDNSVWDNENIQIESGSTATSYEPYSNICPITAYTEGEIEVSDGDGNTTTHTTTFPSAIYRGSEDCVNGEVECDSSILVLDGVTTGAKFTNKGTSTNVDDYYLIIADAKTYGKQSVSITNEEAATYGLICSHLVYNAPASTDVINYRIYIGSGSTFQPRISFPLSMGIDTVEKANQWLASQTNPVQITYELATPTTSSVTPTNLPIHTLSGYNHIESSTGDMEIEYITEGEQAIIDCLEDYADNAAEEAASSMIDDTESSSTKTWSSNKISSEVSSGDTSIRSNIASTYDPTKTYNVGNIVYQNNTLYRCFVDNTTGTWDATKWRETTVAELIETLSAQPTSWDDVQALVRSGVAPQIFQIGDQLICQKDGVNIVWDVLAHNQDVPTDSTLTRSMTLGMHNIYAMMMFDNKEAAFTTESGLTAGIYNFTVGQHPWVSADVGKTYQFTLTQDVPANGQIVFNNAYNVTFNNATVSTYSDGTSTTAIESATMTEGSSGTSLGTINNAGTPASGINSIQRALLGSNNYKESAIRQWLNSDQAAGAVWTPQTKFDRPPDWRNSSKGFMNGLDADFKAVIGEITFNTARNTVSDGGGYDTMSDKFRLLARENVYAGKEVSTVDEGGVYDYYSKYSSHSSASTSADTNRVKRYNNSPNWWWLRSPSSGTARNARSVYSGGALSGDSAVGGGGVVVACNVV